MSNSASFTSIIPGAARPSEPVASVRPSWKKKLLPLLMGGAAALAVLPAGYADTVAADKSHGNLIPDQDIQETVLVTATLRSEPLQKVPLAVSVVDGDLSSFQNLNNINAIATIVPSLNFRDGQSNKDQGLFIRGVGTVTTSPGAEPSVSTVIDGVVLVRPGQATFDLVDVDHIEVLRGPQGTLFGKNASAGVVNVATKNPTADFEGSGEISYYEGNELRIKGSVSGPLTDKLEGLVSVLFGNYDGNVTNVRNNNTVNGYRKYGTRTKLAYAPSEALHIQLTADYLYSYSSSTAVVAGTDITYPNGVVTHNAAYAALLSPVVVGADNRRINTNQPTYVIDTNAGVSGEVTYKLGDYTLTSISAYRKWHNNQVSDNDLTAASAYLKQIADHGRLDFDQVSEELRIASPKGQFVEFVGGLYYLHAEDREIYQRTDTAAGGATVNTGIAHYGTKNDNYALFAEATVNLSPELRAIVGGRVIGDDLSYHHTRVSTAADSGIAVSSPYTSDQVTKVGYASRLGLQYDLANDVFAYFTYTHGYKGPAYNVFFNMVPATQGKVLNPETSSSYELGLKSRLFDNQLILNAAAFWTEFKNFQANFPNLINGTVVTNLVNAGTAATRGVEADFTVAPIENFTVLGGIAYTNAYIKDTDIVGRNWAIKGQPLPFTPTWKLNLRGNYRYPLSDDYTVNLGTEGRWQSKVQYDLSESPDTIEGAFGIWNADVSLENATANWSISLLVKNILDRHYSSYLQSSGATAASGTAGYITRWVPRDDSRYIGISLRKAF